MDFEAAWREAMAEEEAQQPNRQAATGLVNKADAYDEFSDEGLLQSVPFAHDAAAASTVFIAGAEPLGVATGARSAAPGATPRSAHCADSLSASASATTTTVTSAVASEPQRQPRRTPVSAAPPAPRGVLEFPPMGSASFLCRGDDGRVRWVTTSARTSAAALPRRRRAPCPTAEVVDVENVDDVDDVVVVDADGDADSDVAVVAVRSGARTQAAAATPSTTAATAPAWNPEDDDDDEEDIDRGALDRQRRGAEAAGFLRDGADVRAMLRALYAEEAEARRRAQAAAASKEEEATRERDDGAGSNGEDEVLDDEAREEAARLARAPLRRNALSRPPPPQAAPRTAARSSGGGGGDLWVTKYSPKLFRELLSDETVNLRLLQWLKAWDAYVFPDDAPTGASTTAAAAAAAAAPPDDRIAVLTGPPGVGKTTLVHVLATHCGYEVIEVNASVERTASRLEALIKTAVSAAGPAPGGRLRRAAPASSTSEVTAAAGADGATSLVHHLLRPKCLVIDEMDGIASSSVAAYLVQLQLHRPVFCLCNDLYVPSLRPLRQRCSHVYHMPPIRPQRLLARLEEIARREGPAMFDTMALSELITASGGDVRSCLNTMQFINSVVLQQQQQQQQQQQRADGGRGGGATAAPTSRQSVAELIRRMQGKDTRVALRDSWQLLFTRPERTKAVQQLKLECSVDYEALVEAAAAQHSRHVVPARRAMERKRALGSASSTAAPTTGSGSPQQRQPVAMGFRVDPGYLYAAHKLARCPDNSGLVDGLQENYLHRAYTDYGFTRTSATADSFSQQDVTVAAAFAHPEVMGTAERLYQVSALTCYVHCSTGARGGRVEFPREQATVRRVQSELRHISQQFRDGCRPTVAAFIGGDEATATEVAPMLLRCLFDRSLRLPAHAIASFGRLAPADQRLMRAAVARHVEYGLDYQKDRQHTPASSSVAAAAGGPVAAPGAAPSFMGGLQGSAADDTPWRLAPELERLLAGVVRPVERALGGYGGGTAGGSGGGFRGTSSSFFASRPSRFQHGSAAGGGASAPAAMAAGGSHGRGRSSALAAVMMPMRNEVRQILSGEIQQYRIVQAMEQLKRQSEASAMAGASRVEAGLKRPRDSDGGAPPVEASTAPTSSHSAEPAAAGGAGGPGEAPEVKRARVHDAVSHAGATATAAATAAVVGGAAPAAPVRRDFFGRPIPNKEGAAAERGRGAVAGRGAGRTTGPSSSTSPSPPPPPQHPQEGASALSSPVQDGGKSRFPRPHSPHGPAAPACVRYVYQDGATNAVKMPATMADF